jgi:hypothetical protein
MDTAIVDVQAMSQGPSDGFDYDRMISDPVARDWAESAAGFITFGLGKAVVKVLEAGNLLAEAKRRLSHGEYLPWVQQACGLRPQHASQLIKAAEWVNVGRVQHLEGVTDVKTLFLLSADATPEDVREWFMERAAAGDVPSRAEVAERKRRAAGKPAAPRPVELQALSLVRRQQIGEMEAALAIARQITTVTEAQLLAELGLRELPKAKVLAATSADFHRRPDGSGWDRIPHAGRIEVSCQANQCDLAPPASSGAEVVDRAAAAARIGMTPNALSVQLNPKKNPSGVVRGGLRLTRVGRGLVQVEPVAHTAT